MSPDHRRARISYLALLVTVVAASPGAAETIAGTDLEAAELVADLPWSFEVASEPIEPGSAEGPARATRHRFKSAAPIESTAAGDIYLRAELTTYEHVDAESARAAFDDLLAGADPDIGLSYAWDRLLRSGAVVYCLHGGCLWSQEAFQRVAERLEAAVRPDQRIACRCGGGCRELPVPSDDPKLK